MHVCLREKHADKYRSAHLEPKRKLIKERANYGASYLHNLDDNLENSHISEIHDFNQITRNKDNTDQVRLISTSLRYTGQHLHVAQSTEHASDLIATSQRRAMDQSNSMKSRN